MSISCAFTVQVVFQRFDKDLEDDKSTGETLSSDTEVDEKRNTRRSSRLSGVNGL